MGGSVKYSGIYYKQITIQVWARLKISANLLCSIERSAEFFFTLFKFRITLFWISPFKLKMDEITRAEWLNMRLKDFILLEYHLSK